MAEEDEHNSKGSSSNEEKADESKSDSEDSPRGLLQQQLSPPMATVNMAGLQVITDNKKQKTLKKPADSNLVFSESERSDCRPSLWLNPTEIQDQRIKLEAMHERNEGTPTITATVSEARDLKGPDQKVTPALQQSAPTPGAFAVSPSPKVEDDVIVGDDDHDDKKRGSILFVLEATAVNSEHPNSSDIIQERPTSLSATCMNRLAWVAGLVFLCILVRVIIILVEPSQESQINQYPLDPPTSEDCAAVLKGSTIQNQDKMTVKFIDTVLDVTTKMEVNDTVLVDEMTEIAEVDLIPLLVGCNEKSTRQLRIARGLQIISRHVIANALVTNVTRVDGESCKKEAAIPCYRVTVSFKVWLKQDVPSIMVIAMLVDLYSEEIEIQITKGSIVEDVGYIELISPA